MALCVGRSNFALTAYPAFVIALTVDLLVCADYLVKSCEEARYACEKVSQ
jgi:hypothetical protein